jgi:hypothetical protein
MRPVRPERSEIGCGRTSTSDTVAIGRSLVVPGGAVDVAVRVHAKVTGQRRSPFGPHDLIVTVAAGQVSAAEFLASVVAAEVAEFGRRSEERQFLRVLSGPSLAADLESGRVRAGEVAATSPVDLDAAVAEAQLAFSDGFFKLFIDDVEVESAEAMVGLPDGAEVLFLRLVPLAGG